MQLTPLKLNLLLHIYAIASDFNHPNKPIYQEVKDEFLEEELTYLTPGIGCGYKLTRKGEVFIEAILTTPLPVLQYVMPSRL